MANPPDKPLNTDSEQTWEPGQLLLDDFEVQHVLGQGGMGKVYLVRSQTTAMEFAVKHALIRDDNSRQNFLSELQTWIDLPEHPHIAACRFFRTIGDEIAIFAEYISGGTLADWIRDRRLTTLEQILDVAIQFAWGLQALHEHGLIHQDVKPGNLLMTPDGIAKVTDFGLARARLRGSDGQFHLPTPAPDGHSVLVSFGGMTQAYCSPEQAAKQPVSRKTDIWSWGVSVLDMFYGEMSCRHGQTAGESLGAYFEEGAIDEVLPRMPVEMTIVLGKCFQPKPEHRWDRMSEAAEALIPLYEKSCGRSYPRKIFSVSRLQSAIHSTHDCRTVTGEEWVDARRWLKTALEAAGRNPSEADALTPPPTGSRRAQAIAVLAVYERAYRILKKLVADGRKDLEEQLADLCFEKAHVHTITDDLVGAVAVYDRAIQLYERLENLPRLAFTCGDKAITLRRSGDLAGAVGLYDRAIKIYEMLLSLKYNQQLARHVAHDYMNKAVAISELGDQRGAVALCDLAIPIYKRLVDHDGRQELANALAMAWMNKANSLHFLGQDHEAVACYDRVIEIRERLVNQDGRREFEHFLAAGYTSKAMAVSALGNKRDAITLYDRGILIYERLVNQDGQRRELGHALAKAYMNKAASLHAVGDFVGAAAFGDQTIQLYERMVNQEGRRELAKNLALAYMNASNAASALGDKQGRVTFCDRAISMYERLVNQEGRQELAAELALAYMKKAFALSDLGGWGECDWVF
jgi:serine/threonine protein kinase